MYYINRIVWTIFVASIWMNNNKINKEIELNELGMQHEKNIREYLVNSKHSLINNLFNEEYFFKYSNLYHLVGDDVEIIDTKLNTHTNLLICNHNECNYIIFH